MRIAMDVAYPCLVFHSIMKYMVLSGNETLSSVSFSLQAIGAGALELLLGIASAWLVAKMLRMRIGTGLRTFTLTAGVQNYAFFVIPIIQMLFTASNDPTLGVLFVHNVGCELVVWSIGVIIIAGGPGNLNMGVFFRGPLLAVIVGLALAWSGLGTYVAQPPLMKTFEMIGNCATTPVPDPVRLFHERPVAQHEVGAQTHHLRAADAPGTGSGAAAPDGLFPAGGRLYQARHSSSRRRFPPPSSRSF